MLRGKQGTPARGSPAGAVRWPVARLPPSSFFLVSAVFHYLGPSLAVLLFLRVPVLGMAWLRIVSAAVVFAVWRRPWRLIPRLDRAQRTVLVQLGVVLAAMNSLFYLALARLPLATVGAVEFLGTVLLAASAARSRRNVLALALTTIGVAAITDVRLAGQPLGFLYAFGNCVLFMCYVILGHRIARSGAASADHHPGHGAGRDRSAGGLDAHRRRGGDPGRAGRRPAGLRPSRAAAGGGGGRRVLVGHPVRHRSAGHGQAAPRELRAHACPAADVRHRHRRARPSPVPDPPGPARHRAGDHRCRGAQGARAHDQRGEHSCVTPGWARRA